MTGAVCWGRPVSAAPRRPRGPVGHTADAPRRLRVLGPEPCGVGLPEGQDEALVGLGPGRKPAWPQRAVPAGISDGSLPRSAGRPSASRCGPACPGWTGQCWALGTRRGSLIPLLRLPVGLYQPPRCVFPPDPRTRWRQGQDTCILFLDRMPTSCLVSNKSFWASAAPSERTGHTTPEFFSL